MEEGGLYTNPIPAPLLIIPQVFTVNGLLWRLRDSLELDWDIFPENDCIQPGELSTHSVLLFLLK